MPLRILIADDSRAVRHSLYGLLEQHPGWEVCAEAVDGADAVDKAQECVPDIILLDFFMPGMTGVDAARVSLLTFVIGAVLGALGGALASPTTSLVPGIGADMIVLSFTVVATAGLGQIGGAALAALIIGCVRSFMVYLLPDIEVLVPYLIMVIVLLIRPQGLFAGVQARRV